MKFLLLSIGALTIFEPVLATTPVDHRVEQTEEQASTENVSRPTPQVAPVPTNLGLYGGQNGHKIFVAASKEVITRLVDDLAEIPFHHLRCYTQRKTWFLGFLEGLGKKRQAIAKKTKSTNEELYGLLRSSTEEKSKAPFINSVVLDYSLMHGVVLSFFCANGIKDKEGDFTIQISPHTQIQGMNLSIASLRINSGLIEQFHLFVNDKIAREALLLDVVKKSLLERGHYKNYTLGKDGTRLRIAILQEYREINGFQVPGRGFGMLYDLSATDAALRVAPLSLCHPLLFPHMQADVGVKEKKGDYLLDETMNYFFQAVQEPRNSHDEIAKFIYNFAITTPYIRGSAAIGEWIYQALCRFHNIQPIVPQVFSHLDQLAQSFFTFDEFWTEYQRLMV